MGRPNAIRTLTLAQRLLVGGHLCVVASLLVLSRVVTERIPPPSPSTHPLDNLFVPEVWGGMLLAASVGAIQAVLIAWASGLGASLLYAKLSTASTRRRSVVLALAPVLLGIAWPFAAL